MSELDDAAHALADAVLLDASPQADALADAVARHLSTRPVVDRQPPDPAVLELLRKEQP